MVLRMTPEYSCSTRQLREYLTFTSLIQKGNHSPIYIFFLFSQPKTAGVLLMATGGRIKANSVEHMDTACKLSENKVIHPFAFRTHTHALGELFILQILTCVVTQIYISLWLGLAKGFWKMLLRVDVQNNGRLFERRYWRWFLHDVFFFATFCNSTELFFFFHIGRVVSGYKVTRKNSVDEWTLIGKRDPQLPQMFYPVANNMTLSKGDTVVSFCYIIFALLLPISLTRWNNADIVIDIYRQPDAQWWVTAVGLRESGEYLWLSWF